MPPPELYDRSAPASVGALLLENLRIEVPMSRHTGPRAEEAYLRAQLAESRAVVDPAAERASSIALARYLAQRGRDLGAATRLSRRALLLGDDAALRVELAGWLSALGERSLAAATLRGLVDPDKPAEAARMLVKIAVLLARGEETAGAVEALREASALEPQDAMASELLGTLAAWAPDAVGPAEAASAYLEAARRREAAGDKDAAFEDRLRALELAPESDAAAEAVAEALIARGRAGAADEVRRAHAEALANIDESADEETIRARALGAMAANRRRLAAALKAEDAGAALGAVLDAGLEGTIGGEDAAAVDEALALSGLYELCALRLELSAEQERGAARAATYQELAKLLSGPLASPDRAIEAWIEAAADLVDDEALAALRAHAESHQDHDPLIEALIRLGSGPMEVAEEARAHRIKALRELFTLASGTLDDAALASFALDRLAMVGAEAALVEAERPGLAARLAQQDEARREAARAVETAGDPEARRAAQIALLPLLRGRVAEPEALSALLVDLCSASPADRAHLAALERLSARRGDFEPLAEVLRRRLASDPSRVELSRARLGLSALARRRGDEAKALDEVLPLLTEAPGHRGAACTALFLATRADRGRARADALVQLAGPVWPALRSTLLAVAAELYDAAGDPETARRTAEQAAEADPTCGRAATVLGTIAGRNDDRDGAAALERAMTVVLPHGATCGRLARIFEVLGDKELALAWTQRWLALCPGSVEAMAELLRRAAKVGDPAPIADALGWVLAQPKPLSELTEPIADTLDALLATDRSRARAFARRALDVLGPRVPILRARLLRLAEKAADPGLSIAVLERYVAVEGLGAFACELLIELAERRTAAGDYDGAARELSRAVEGGADPGAVLAQVDALEQAMREAGAWLGSDGLIAHAEARAAALAALAAQEPPAPAEGQADPPDPARIKDAAANAYRELGSLRWDLAEDRRGAEEAFFRAGELAPRGGVERYARDLLAFAGVDYAIEALAMRAGKLRGDDARKMRANLLIEAANLANEHGQAEHALVAASSAIESDPSRADAVALVEKNAHVEGGLPILDHTYDLLAAAALGRYGRRAAHYRGARQLERRGALDLALRHAAACFEAVPGEGTSYVLLSRLAERVDDPTEAVRALERVAADGHAGDRTIWLKRAAALAGKTEEGARVRLDLLLRALNLRPDPDTVAQVGKAVTELLGFTGDREVVALRYERAVKASLTKLDGPDGARAAVAMARLAVDLGTSALAFAALVKSMAADGDIDEYLTLSDLVPALIGEGEASRGEASRWIESVRTAADRPYSSVGPALLRLAARVAAALGDERTRATLLIQAVKRATDDDALVDEADRAVAALGDEALDRAFEAVLPPSRKVEALLHLAEQHEREGNEDLAIEQLERAIASGDLRPEAHDRAARRLRSLLHQKGRLEDADVLLRDQLDRGELSPEARSHAARELAASIARRGDTQGALDLLVAEAGRGAVDAELLTDLKDLAGTADEGRRYAELLGQILDQLHPGPVRLPILRELAPLAEELGDHAASIAHYAALSQLDPADEGALERLEQDANERGDHEAIADLLGRRIAAAPSAERRRMLHLRRAAVLEQRLGRLEDAAGELEQILAEVPDDVSTLRFLTDIQERLGASRKAAELLRRLGDLSGTSDEKADYALRASAAYIAAGDCEAAEDLLETVAPIAERESVAELRVELARKRGDGQALSDELDRLAACSRAPADRRAAILLEASRAALAVGDEAAALDRVRRAAKLAPGWPDAVLESKRLSYRSGGAGAPREAQITADDLGRIAARLTPEQVPLHAFLLAEVLDAVQGGGAGMRELSRRHAEVGALPLVALGMAERLVRSKSFEAAVPLFEQALGGDLQGVRSRGKVALAASEAAMSALDLDAAARFLEMAVSEPETRAVAQRKQLEVVAARGEPAEARKALEELVRRSSGAEKGRALFQLGKLLASNEPEAAGKLFAEATPLAATDRALAAEIAEAVARLPAAPAPSAAARGASTPAASAPAAAGKPAIMARLASAAPRLAGTPSAAMTPASEPSSSALLDAAPDSLPPMRSVLPLDDSPLVRELQAGSFEAGEQLVELYGARSAERAHDVMIVRRQQALIHLGDADALRKLCEAAMHDGNTVYGRAVEHVLALVDPSITAPQAPPLAGQRPAPDLVAALLFRSIADSPVHEALAIVLETGLYRRDVGQYQLTGVARVQPGAATPLGETFGAVSRFLGQGRTALFYQRSAAALTTKIALLSPPAIVLTGEVREETPELRYQLGASLAGAMPEHALVNALGDDALHTLIDALHAAFGPVANLPKGNAAVARLGQNLWQLVSPRADRRLRELCAKPESITYEAAVTGTRQAMRRAGLFGAGNLTTALGALATELGLPPGALVDPPVALARACEDHPSVADLVRLALRAEFAEARWVTGSTPDRRRSEVAPRTRAGTS
ncbi:MAG: hypothetical protein U0359_09855 [Byssovorax sp.]